MENLFLTGFMATGKTAVGKELARRLGARFVDTDAEIERSAGRTVAEIFRERGEVGFRELERKAIESACGLSGAVVATGGGAIVDPVNRSRMRSSGKIVCLEATPEAILDRAGSADSRPLLAGAPEPIERVRELLAERAPAYATADCRIDTSALSPVEIAERILEWLKR